MKKLFLFFLILTLADSSSFAVDTPSSEPNWIASGGFGFMFNPTLALFAPQLEHYTSPNTLMGPLVQLGLGSSSLVTVNWGVRYLSATKKKFKPSIQAALGVAVGTASSFPIGPHLLVGMGFDYQLDKRLSFGSMLNVDFAPLVQLFYVSWPLLVGRFAL